MNEEQKKIEESSEEKKRPVRKFKIGSFKICIWEHEGEYGIYKTASLQRNFKQLNKETKEEEWKTETINLRLDDFYKIIRLLNRSYDDGLMVVE